MFCDLARYVLSARGSMCGHEADPLRDAILLLPDDCTTTIDISDTTEIDHAAAAIVASAIRRSQRHRGIKFSILVASETTVAILADAGLSKITHHRRLVNSDGLSTRISGGGDEDNLARL